MSDLIPYNSNLPMPSWRERRDSKKSARERRELVAKAETDLLRINLRGVIAQAQVHVVEAILNDSEAVSDGYSSHWLRNVARERADLIQLSGRLDPGFGPWAASLIEAGRGSSYLSGLAAVDAFRDSRIREV